MVTIDTLKEAFRKLLSYSYYDKTDMIARRRVGEFAKSLSRKNDEDVIFARLLRVAQGNDVETLENLLGQIRMVYYPKTIREERESDNHLVTNIPPNEALVERLLIKADIPIELCILDVAWVLEYGYMADGDLMECCWGNRLDINANKAHMRRGDVLFKKYQTQYSNWWRKGLNKANERLKEKENISIVSFDITNYYHSVDFIFEQFFEEYESLHQNGVRTDSLTGVVMRVYEQYWKLTQDCGEEAFLGQNRGKHPLPLSLMSAHVLANWYLKPLDEFIVNTYHPLYYGRYVDDCMVVVNTKSISNEWEKSIDEELPGLFQWNEESVVFAFSQGKNIDAVENRLSSLELQKKKVYVYRFNCMLPPSALEEFEENQKERSSEFRFLTDDADVGAVNLEDVTLVSALDAVEESGRRFNILEENKYRLAVYLAKLSSRLAKFGMDYPRYEEVDKVHAYFRGQLLVKHYALWERLMTVFVLAGRKKYVESFADAVRKQVKMMTCKETLFADEKQDQGAKTLKDTLLHHLEESRTMALSLNKEELAIDTLYLDTFMVRMHYNMLPLQEFCYGFRKDGVRLKPERMLYRKDVLTYRWMPYYVKYYDIVIMLSLGAPYDPYVFEKAFVIYNRLNRTKNYISASDFCHHLEPGSAVSEFNPHLNIEGDGLGDFTVAVVNMDLDNKEGETQITDFGKVKADRTLTMQHILDKITEIGDIRIFVLPEMALPLYELREYCLYASKKERAFVAGMEYVVKKRTA